MWRNPEFPVNDNETPNHVVCFRCHRIAGDHYPPTMRRDVGRDWPLCEVDEDERLSPNEDSGPPAPKIVDGLVDRGNGPGED